MVIQHLFSVFPPEKGPFRAETVVESEPKRVFVHGEAIDGWIVTVRSDEDEVHFILDSIDDGE